MKNLYALAIILAQAGSSSAQSSTTNTPESSPKSNLKISGFADVYFQLNDKKVQPLTSFTSETKTFALGMASVKLEKNFSKVGLVADLGWGKRADDANGSIGTSLGSIKQLYMTYSPKSNLKFTIGNFFTYFGYEYVDAPLNNNYSMSYGFSKGPFFHNGIKADYNLNDKWAIMLGVFNETDQKIDLDGSRDVGGQISYSKGKFKGYLNYIGGKVASDTLGLKNNQIDLTCLYQLSTKAAFGLNVSDKFYTRKNTTTSWITNAVYFTYTFNDNWNLAARTEFFIDKDGEALGILKNNVFDATATLSYKVNDLRLSVEARTDSANKPLFFGENQASYKHFETFLLAAVYSF